MFDIGAAEILLILAVAVAVVGPKEMPAALRQAGRWLGKLRRMSNHVRSGIDTVIREAEMEDMEKDWKAQNEDIMRKHPSAPDDIAEFESMRGASETGAQGPEMGPLAAPTDAGAPTAPDLAEPARDPEAPPLPSELPQLPFDKDEG